VEFGIQFFPCVEPEVKSAANYWRECLHLAGLGDKLGFTSIRTVEHYFHPYGGYTPNPIVFLAAAAMVTKRARLQTGAVLPVFNNPLKMAGEIGMARAFLPHEFDAFGISMDESRDRFNEGVEQIRLLLESENVSYEGKFRSFKNVTSLPRPTQKPRPPFWFATSASPESFINAGRLGHGLMTIPIGGNMAEVVQLYRNAWREAGHPGNGRVMVAFHMFCAETREKAFEKARAPLNKYLAMLGDATSSWQSRQSKDYANYSDRMKKITSETFETAVEKGTAWVGTPDDIIRIARGYQEMAGDFDIASLQVNFADMNVDDAESSIRLFAANVMPHLSQKAPAAAA
jgi:alkanesulfonate monooxygenase SsuD/methylene tetrahydromethanopterin reductase-like flavin-dependent oxidoreductase (luciferase family)